jgi:D-alanyl-D-alanine dipeptidase
MSDYTGRIARLQDLMQRQGIRLALLSWTDQMRYLTGFAENGHKRFLSLLLPSQGEPAFVVPAMNAQQARQNPAGIERVLGWDDTEGWHGCVSELLREHGIRSGDTAIIDDELYSVHLLGFQALVPGLNCLPADDVIARLRSIKTGEELAAMDRAAQLIDTIFEESVVQLAEGMTETEFQDVIHAGLKRHATTPSFTPLICFGANGSMPHHHSGSTRLQKGDVVIVDIGCHWEGYCSDITRTVAYGAPADADAARVYAIVSAAHWAARDAARPGVACEAVDHAARAVITEAGYGPQFMHRTGHGIGLSGHEPPYIRSGDATLLEPAMCFSVEPGIYLPGRFGVRIENIVTVTPDGVRSMNADAPRELRIVGA